MHCVKSFKKRKKKENAYKEFGSEMRLRDSCELSTCTSIDVDSFGSEPGFEQLLIIAAQSIFQIEKSHSGSL